MTDLHYICTMHTYIMKARRSDFDGLNIACINSIGGMSVMENRSIIIRLRDMSRPTAVGAGSSLSRFGTLLREAAAIAFVVRCKVIGGR
ncbi:MAG: hypothetical protein QM684_19935 [Rhizobium sp.]